MITDFEAVVADLRAHIVSKRSHGQTELLLKLAEAEATHRVEEGMPEKYLRLMGTEIYEGIHDREPASPARESGDAVATG